MSHGWMGRATSGWDADLWRRGVPTQPGFWVSILDLGED